jgi:hypothetical protein
MSQKQVTKKFCFTPRLVSFAPRLDFGYASKPKNSAYDAMQQFSRNCGTCKSYLISFKFLFCVNKMKQYTLNPKLYPKL